MSKAVLHLFDKEFSILYFGSEFHSLTDYRGQPWGTPDGGLISVVIPCPKKPSEFLDSMLSDQIIRGKIQFWKWDGIHIDAELEFANAYIVERETNFYSTGTNNYTMRVVISPGIQRYRGTTFEKSWNPSNPFKKSTTPMIMRETPDTRPKVIRHYITDLQGTELDEYQRGDHLYCVLETDHMLGKTVDIDLSTFDVPFLYQGKRIKDQIIRQYTIGADIEKIALQVIPENYEDEQ